MGRALEADAQSRNADRASSLHRGEDDDLVVSPADDICRLPRLLRQLVQGAEQVLGRDHLPEERVAEHADLRAEVIAPPSSPWPAAPRRRGSPAGGRRSARAARGRARSLLGRTAVGLLAEEEQDLGGPRYRADPGHRGITLSRGAAARRRCARRLAARRPRAVGIRDRRLVGAHEYGSRVERLPRRPDDRGDERRAPAPVRRTFLHAGEPARLLDARDDRRQIERGERPRIDQLHVDALGGERLGRLECPVPHQLGRNHCQIRAAPHDVCTTEIDRGEGVGDVGTDRQSSLCSKKRTGLSSRMADLRRP